MKAIGRSYGYDESPADYPFDSLRLNHAGIRTAAPILVRANISDNLTVFQQRETKIPSVCSFASVQASHLASHCPGESADCRGPKNKQPNWDMRGPFLPIL